MGAMHFHPNYRKKIEEYLRGNDCPYELHRGAISLKQPPYGFPDKPLAHLRSDFIERTNSENAAVKEEQEKLEEIVHRLILKWALSRTG